MSRKIEELATCKCGQSFKVELWESVNVSLNPELRDRVLDGSLFRMTCPGCKKESGIRFPVLYHDMERNFMVQLALPEEAQQAEAELARVMGKLPALPGLRRRMVMHPMKLSEKIMIFEAGLDDHTVEATKIKAVGEEGLIEQFRDGICTEASPDGALRFRVVLTGHEDTVEISSDPDLYNLMRDLTEEAFEGRPEPKRFIQVDPSTTVRLLRGESPYWQDSPTSPQPKKKFLGIFG